SCWRMFSNRSSLSANSASLESKRVLHLRRCPIEGGFKRPVERLQPPAIDDDEQIVARLQDPSKTPLKTQETRLVVVLLQVLPRHVRREVVVRSRGDHLCEEPSLAQRDVVAVR